MATITSGSNATGTFGTADSITVTTRGNARFECPTGTTVAEFSGTRTFGPYTSATFRVTAVSGATDYEVLDGSGPRAEVLADIGTGTLYANGSPVSGAWNFIRWCIPGKDTSGTLFKDVSGKGNDATIEASNTTPFAVDSRISTVAHGSAGGVVQALAATLCDFTADSLIMAVSVTNEDPAANESIVSFGAGTSSGQPGLYLSHRASAAGVARVVANRGNGTLVSGSDTTVKISNAGGTRETHVLIAYDAPTGSVYLYRDGVLAAANAGLMTGANVWTASVPVFGARLGSTGGTAATVAGVYRGWQGYVFSSSSLPLNIGRIAAILAESPSVPLNDGNFTF